MILKTALAALITASLAGGVVYYGTQSETTGYEEVNLDAHPHKSIKNQDQDTTIEDDDFEVDEPADRVIDRLLNRNSGSDTGASEITTTETVTKTTKVTETVSVEDDENDEVDNREPISDEFDDDQGLRLSDPIKTIDKSFEEGALSEIDKLNLIELVFEQTDNIKAVELKDQAYLDVVSYAVKHKLYRAADQAMTKINQVELRDTARSQMAVSLAKNGNSAKAFDLIDQVETEGLRDIMRLQVIEAMILPERLPAALLQP